MKRLMILALAISFSLAGCTGQSNNGTKPDKKKKGEIASNLQNQPNVKIKVNKKYDENGNLIAEDSSYVWTYSNQYGDSLFVPTDSVWNRFQPFFNDQFPSLFRQHFNNKIIRDSTFSHGFFNDDFFFHNWKNDFFDMNKMFHEMDSLKNEFFKRNYPPFPEKKKPGKTL